MKAASRVAVCAAIIAAVGPSAASAVSPVSNGVGDGEANVPFASPPVGAQEEGRAAAGIRDPGDRRDRAARQRDRDRDRDAAGRDRDRDRAPDAGSGLGGTSRDSPHTGP